MEILATRSVVSILTSCCIAAAHVPALAQASCPATLTATRTLPGAAAGDLVGAQVAINALGDRVFMGAPMHMQGGIKAGAVLVITNPGTALERRAELQPSFPVANGHFGLGLATDRTGDVAVVGAPCLGAVQGSIPRVSIHRRNGQVWSEEWVRAGSTFSYLGMDVDISRDGTTVAAGASNTAVGGFAGAGVVEIYRRVAGNWVVDATIDAPDLGEYNGFGSRLTLSGDGDVLAVRSKHAVAPILSGSVYVFERIAGAWTQVAWLQEPQSFSSGGWGNSLCISDDGDTLVVGNPLDSRSAQWNGALSIFERGPAGWQFDQWLVAPIPIARAKLGQSVSINASGDRLFAGAPEDWVGGNPLGAVVEFYRTSSGWAAGATLGAPSVEPWAYFGQAVATTESGSRCVVGAPYGANNGAQSGVAHVFTSPCLQPVVYCTAQVNSLGCTPTVGAEGVPSASSPNGFRVAVRNVRNQQNGMLLYGANGRAATPWLGGTLCVQPPLRRTPLLTSGGSLAPANDCSGSLVRDFNAWTFSANDPALVAGQLVLAQFYSRDPGAPGNINLSDAIEFYLEP